MLACTEELCTQNTVLSCSLPVPDPSCCSETCQTGPLQSDTASTVVAIPAHNAQRQCTHCILPTSNTQPCSYLKCLCAPSLAPQEIFLPPAPRAAPRLRRMAFVTAEHHETPKTFLRTSILLRHIGPYQVVETRNVPVGPSLQILVFPIPTASNNEV